MQRKMRVTTINVGEAHIIAYYVTVIHTVMSIMVASRDDHVTVVQWQKTKCAHLGLQKEVKYHAYLCTCHFGIALESSIG